MSDKPDQHCPECDAFAPSDDNLSRRRFIQAVGGTAVTLAGLQAEEALVSRVAPRLVREVGADRSRPSHETLRRDSRYRRLLIAADILAASVALAFLAALSPGAGSAWLVALLLENVKQLVDLILLQRHGDRLRTPDGLQLVVMTLRPGPR